MKAFFVTLLFSCLGFSSIAQDSLSVLGLKEFLILVQNNHPIIKQTDLMGEGAQREIGVTRGNFDPKYDFDYTRKVFKGTTYFDYLDNGLKIPTWIGADLKAGFEKNSGLFVNPTNFTPPSGLLYFGVDVPIGKGLWMDERRALVRQAQAAAQMTDGERRKLQLKLMSSAIKDYLDWSLLYERQKLLISSVKLAEVRMEGIRQRVIQGDLPSIDSVEAMTVLNDRRNELVLNENNLVLQKNSVELYLWSPEGLPLEMEDIMVPSFQSDVLVLPNPNTFRDSVQVQHPEIIKLRAKVAHFKIEQSLRRNELLPGIVFSAKYLNTPDHSFRNDLNYSYLQDNYKIQLALVQPLFIRKEVNKMKLSGIKLSMVENELSLASRELNNDLDNAFISVNTWSVYKQRQRQNSNLLKQLFEGEQERFVSGESTVFLVNSRESKWLEGASKDLEAQVKYEKAILDVYLGAGVFPMVR
jgi:outer membrane protein TolC